MRHIGRRRFLYWVGGMAGLSSGLLPRGVRAADDAARTESQAGELPVVTRSSRALGSTVSISAQHPDKSVSTRALDAAFDELELVEQLMSIYRPDSQLSRLNRDRVLGDPHPYLLEVLWSARETSQRTRGAFDVTIQPLWDLYTRAAKAGELPSDQEVRAALQLVDWRRVELGSGCVRLRGAGTRITLNGIAQGFAADRVAATFREHGIERALIDTGELGAVGSRQQTNGWRIGIQHPRDPNAYLSVVKLAGRCLATSGDYATTFTPDHRHHHLFDPRTGYSPGELSSVSIVADKAIEADALSTAVFVLGLDAGLRLIDATDGADAMLVTKDRRNFVTEGFPIA